MSTSIVVLGDREKAEREAEADGQTAHCSQWQKERELLTVLPSKIHRKTNSTTHCSTYPNHFSIIYNYTVRVLCFVHQSLYWNLR